MSPMEVMGDGSVTCARVGPSGLVPFLSSISWICIVPFDEPLLETSFKAVEEDEVSVSVGRWWL